MVLYEMKMYKAHVDVSSADNMDKEKSELPVLYRFDVMWRHSNIPW